MIRPLAAAAVAALALGAAPKPAPHAGHAAHGRPAPHAARKAAPKLVDVRAVVVSGNHQNLHAYVAASMAKYVVDYPKPLIVTVRGPSPQEGDRIVVFSCLTPGCVFASADQPDEGKHVDRVGAVYKVTVVKGRAVVHVILEGDAPNRDYVVQARPSVHDGERAVAASFTLTMH